MYVSTAHCYFYEERMTRNRVAMLLQIYHVIVARDNDRPVIKKWSRSRRSIVANAGLDEWTYVTLARRGPNPQKKKKLPQVFNDRRVLEVPRTTRNVSSFAGFLHPASFTTSCLSFFINVIWFALLFAVEKCNECIDIQSSKWGL